MSRVVLTGASGFVGREALAALARDGHEVHALGRRPGPEDARVRWHKADLLADPHGAAMVLEEIEPEVLLHLAWCSEHGRFWTSSKNLDWVEASLRLLRQFVDAGGRRVVISGTCAEYEWTRAVYAEDAPCVPSTLYGAAKHGLRVVAEAFTHERGISFAWGRLFFLYGPGEAPGRFVPSLARALIAGAPAPMTEGTQVRDFLHVADVGSALAALVAGGVDGPVNIGSGRGVSLHALALLIARHAGGTEQLRVGAIPTRPGEPSSLVADVTRLSDEVDWEPRVALEDGIAAVVAQWSQEGLDG